jgi:formate dehydrogenase subunit gamma
VPHRAKIAGIVEPRVIVQAMGFDADRARAIAMAHRDMPGAMLPILHALQEAFGYVDEKAEPIIAEVLNLTRADVHGVVTFYHDLRRKPAGAHTLRLCRAEACQSMGGEALAARAEAALGIAAGETTEDGKVTLEAVYCLGLCALAPSAMIDRRVVGRLDAERLDGILAEARK